MIAFSFFWYRTRQYDDDDEFTTCNWMEYVLVVVLSCTLLLGALILVLFWTLYYKKGFAWNEDPQRQFNLHPTLMVTGFISISGFCKWYSSYCLSRNGMNFELWFIAAMLLYRISRCCRHIIVKLFHTVFHILAIPCIALGFFAVFDSKMLQSETHFYSLHSWMGLVTMGMFALQVCTDSLFDGLAIDWGWQNRKFLKMFYCWIEAETD